MATQSINKGEKDPFTEKHKSPYAHLPWKYYGFWRCVCTMKCFFCGKRNITIETNTFGETAEPLISTLDKVDKDTLQAGKDLLHLQRDVENTRARRRLERWACIVIVVYLTSVFLLILLNGLSMVWKPNIFDEHGFISDNIMTIILSTTTINIIGLVVIVLRGHFENKKEDKTPD